MKDEKVEKLLSKLFSIETSELRKFFADFLLEVFSGKWIAVTRYGRMLAVFIPMKDAARLQLLKSKKYREVLKAIDAELK